MSIPNANYVVDNDGKKIFVQLSLQDWENFVNEFRRIENLLLLKNKLKKECEFYYMLNDCLFCT